MKYVITKEGKVLIGPENAHHIEIANATMEKVTRAGHYKTVNGKVEVYGKSNGFGIQSKLSDAPLIQRALPLMVSKHPKR